jgi:hypothetical protein
MVEKWRGCKPRGRHGSGDAGFHAVALEEARSVGNLVEVGGSVGEVPTTTVGGVGEGVRTGAQGR